MANIQIRDVPEELHNKLKVQAAKGGLSLNDYLLANILELAALPTWAETSEEIRKLEPYLGPSSAAMIREDRDSH